MAKANILTRSKKHKAAELYKANRLQEADALYAGVCQADGADADAWMMRGIINRKLGRFIEAEAFCRRALALAPKLAGVHHALGAAMQCLGRMDDAIKSYRRAIELQPEFAQAHYFLANALKEVDALDEAVASYRRAIDLQPDFVEALGNLGTLLTLMGQIPEAAAVLNRAARLRPDAHQIQSALGRVLLKEKQAEQAIVHYQMALQLNPCADIASELAVPLEKANRIEEARALIDRYLPDAPNDSALLLVAARLARREGKFQQALDFLEQAVQQKQDSQSRSEILILSGQIYDRLGDGERAFSHLVEGNLLAAQVDEKGSNTGTYLERLDHIGGFLEPGLGDVALRSGRETDQDTPVFVFGFPRSGTTLLEQILDSHPTLQAMEEKGAVDVMFAEFERVTQGRAHALASLTQDEIRQLRGAYFDEVARHIKLRPGSVLVDRMPLNTIYAHLIWRIFPKAKLVLAIRHPCDVCLSCFMQNFAANAATINFYTLESSVEIYEKVMQLWQSYVQELPLDYHRIRYEDLVSNFESETRALLDYIGVGWHENVRNHTEHAIKRGQIKTASYHQVVQPIYQHAKYRWERYSKQFEPLMATLEPFIEYFDYGNQGVTSCKKEAAL